MTNWLQEENMAITQNKKEYLLTSEDVSKMKYTNKVSLSSGALVFDCVIRRLSDG